jgi:hypothetical protein
MTFGNFQRWSMICNVSETHISLLNLFVGIFFISIQPSSRYKLSRLVTGSWCSCPKGLTSDVKTPCWSIFICVEAYNIFAMCTSRSRALGVSTPVFIDRKTGSDDCYGYLYWSRILTSESSLFLILCHFIWILPYQKKHFKHIPKISHPLKRLAPYNHWWY